ncbi:MAG: glycosyltransferase family 4 protein [Bacilli bacterium]|nr:glycosyltransferase family 4 protein [Bacilli bacterium]
MKIIINQPRSSYFVGGAERISFDHAINFYALGHEVHFITLSPRSVGLEYSEPYKKFYEEYSNKISIIEINQDEKARYIYEIEPGEDRCRWNIESIFYNQRLYEYLSEKNTIYDFVFSYYNLDAVFIPRKLINKNVLYLCGIPKQQNDFQGSFLSAYDKVIAISMEVKESWKKYYKEEMKVVSTGVDCNRFLLKSSQSEEKKEITLLYVGRLISRKNVDKIILAFERLKKKYKLKMVIVGDGPDRNRLEKISKYATFVGVVSNTEKYYQEADIFISPSEYGEGLQGTILEAMSCGLTIVATNSKINKELLEDGRGFVVEPTLDSTIEGIIKAIESNRKIIAQKNRKYVLEHYNWIEKTSKLVEVIK